jgi:hypothetical protein
MQPNLQGTGHHLPVLKQQVATCLLPHAIHIFRFWISVRSIKPMTDLGFGDGAPAATMDDDGASVAPSEAESWAAPVPRSVGDPIDLFKKEVGQAMRALGVGPTVYLSRLDAGEVGAFAKWLWEYFPEQDDTCYHHDKRIPPVLAKDTAQTPPLCLHVSTLGMSKECSLKPPPGSDVFYSLADQYLCDGFLTSGEPLLVLQSTEVEGSAALWDPSMAGGAALGTFTVCYLKGMARAASLLALLHYCWKNDKDIKTNHPALYDSVLRIWCHHLEQPTRVDEAILSMKLSARGSIRKAVNVIQTVVMIQNLYACGMTDFGAFVRKWNQSTTKSHQFLGRRALSLKLLFEQAPKDHSH